MTTFIDVPAPSGFELACVWNMYTASSSKNSTIQGLKDYCRLESDRLYSTHNPAYSYYFGGLEASIGHELMPDRSFEVKFKIAVRHMKVQTASSKQSVTVHFYDVENGAYDVTIPKSTNPQSMIEIVDTEPVTMHYGNLMNVPEAKLNGSGTDPVSVTVLMYIKA